MAAVNRSLQQWCAWVACKSGPVRAGAEPALKGRHRVPSGAGPRSRSQRVHAAPLDATAAFDATAADLDEQPLLGQWASRCAVAVVTVAG